MQARLASGVQAPAAQVHGFARLVASQQQQPASIIQRAASQHHSASSRTAQRHWRVQLLPECHCPVPLALHLLLHSSHGMAHSRLSGETMSMQPARMSSSLLPSRMCSLAYRAVCAQHPIAVWLVDVFAPLSVVLAIVIQYHSRLGLLTPASFCSDL